MSGEDPSAWEKRLDDESAALDAREEAVRAGDAAELRSIDEDRDKLAEERDALLSALDRLAADRDLAALDRDARASTRDRTARRPADEDDPGFADRFLSGTDRDASAGNRADSAADRRRASTERQRAADQRRRSAAAAQHAEDKEAQLRQGMETRNVIGQAQGMLMQRYGVSAEAAFEMLVKLSQADHIKLRELARKLAASGRI